MCWSSFAKNPRKMKISLIENGLDSLKKGYEHLKNYEELKDGGASDKERFSKLKDAILSIQHGVEILFKYLLKEHNEVLLFTQITPRLKEAFRKRRAGEIIELFEFDDLHTVTFQESIERVEDICGVMVGEKFKKELLKVVGWRNNIIHSAVVLNEFEVSNVLSKFMKDLDIFFGKAIGEQYLNGQGRSELNRAYRLFNAIRGKHENDIKEKVVERLINALEENKIKNVTSPGVFVIREPDKALSILQKMQGDDIQYGADMRNLHCSGKAVVNKLSAQNILNIFCGDNRADYQLKFGGILIYVPTIEGNASPLIFVYSDGLKPIGNNPEIRTNGTFKTQEGLLLIDEGREVWQSESDETEIWEKDEIYEIYSDSDISGTSINGKK